MAQSSSRARTVLSVVLAYALWLLSAALALWLILQMRLLFLVELPMRMRNINHWAFSAIDKFGFIILGVIWLIFVVVSEEYCRRMIDHGLRLRAVVWLFVVMGVLLGAVYLWLYLL